MFHPSISARLGLWRSTRRLAWVAMAVAGVALNALAQTQGQTQAQNQAQAAAAAPTETPLKEISVAADAFVRGAPVPSWATVLPVPAPGVPSKKPVVVRLADTQLHVAEPQAYVVHRIEQANEASGLGQLGQISLQFNPQYQRLLLHTVAVLRGTQRIDHTATVPVRFLQRETGLEQGMYTGVITASLVLPDVRVGDSLQLIYSVEGENPIFGKRYTGWAGWEQNQPVEWRRVTLVAPENRAVQWRWVGETNSKGSRPKESVANGVRSLQFEERNVAGVDFEPHMPPYAQPLRWLLFSEYKDWNEVAQWALPLFPTDAPLPPELASVMAQFKTLPSDEEKASQALQWVQTQIRYWSVNLGESSHRPHLPAEVLAQRYGDCKDKSLLLSRMLTELGLQARPALASLQTRRGPLDWLPTPYAFDHVIVQLTLNGREIYIDPTRLGQAGALARMGQHMEDSVVLPVSPSTRELATVVSPNRGEIFENQLIERFKLTQFDADGTLAAEQRWVGLNAEAIRLSLPRMDAAQIRKWALGTYERRYPGIQLQGEPQFQDDTAKNQIVIRANYVVPKLAKEFDGDWAVRYFPGNLQGAFALPEQVTRKFPLMVPSFPTVLKYEVEMTWPDSVASVTDPSQQRLDTAYFQLDTSRSFRGNVQRQRVTFTPLTRELPATDVAKLLEDLRKLDQRVGGVLVVGKAQIKGGGFLGLGRNTLQETMRKNLTAQVERVGKAIEAKRVSGDDLAISLCSRAEAKADLGQPAEGLPDALEAVKVAPQLGLAHSCLGHLYYANEEFSKAVAEHTRALPLMDETFHTYRSRGMARFYEGKLEQAAEDFGKAVADKTDESDRLYAQLWQTWTLLRLKQALPAEVVANAPSHMRGAWPRPALAMLAGKLTPDEMLAQLNSQLKGDERELALAEAWFYVGQYHLTQGRTAEAKAAFEKTREKNITMYSEHVAAGFELQRLNKAP